MAKRVFALIGIIALIFLYVLTLICALTNSPNMMNFLGASVAATVVIPVVLWVGMLFFKGREENKKRLEEMKEETKK